MTQRSKYKSMTLIMAQMWYWEDRYLTRFQKDAGDRKKQENMRKKKKKQKDKRDWKKVVERMGKAYSLPWMSMDFSFTPWVYFLTNSLLQVNMFLFSSTVTLPKIHITVTNRKLLKHEVLTLYFYTYISSWSPLSASDTFFTSLNSPKFAP